MDSEQRTSKTSERVTITNRKVWELEQAQQRLVDIPSNGFDYSLVNKLKDGEQFSARFSDGKIYNLIMRDGRIYNSATGLEIT